MFHFYHELTHELTERFWILTTMMMMTTTLIQGHLTKLLFFFSYKKETSWKYLVHHYVWPAKTFHILYSAYTWKPVQQGRLRFLNSHRALQIPNLCKCQDSKAQSKSRYYFQASDLLAATFYVSIFQLALKICLKLSQDPLTLFCGIQLVFLYFWLTQSNIIIYLGTTLNEMYPLTKLSHYLTNCLSVTLPSVWQLLVAEQIQPCLH